MADEIIDAQTAKQILDDIWGGKDIAETKKAKRHIQFLVRRGYLLKTPETTPHVRLTEKGRLSIWKPLTLTQEAERENYAIERANGKHKVSYGDMGVPGDNRFDPSKRGFQPR